jgi:hypothetical protein
MFAASPAFASDLLRLSGSSSHVLIEIVKWTATNTNREREFVTGNELPHIVAHRCIIEASVGKRIVQTIEEPHSPGHRSKHRAA